MTLAVKFESDVNAVGSEADYGNVDLAASESLGMQPEQPGRPTEEHKGGGRGGGGDCTNLHIKATLWDISPHCKDATLETIQT